MAILISIINVSILKMLTVAPYGGGLKAIVGLTPNSSF